MALAQLMIHGAGVAAQGMAMMSPHLEPATWVAHVDQLGQLVGHKMIVLAQATDTAGYAEQVKKAAQEEHLGWLTTLGKHFIGVFQQGGQVFVGFVTGIIPTLVVLMTAFYALDRTGRRGPRAWPGAGRRAHRAHPLHGAADSGGVLPDQSDGLHVRHFPRREAQAGVLRLRRFRSFTRSLACSRTPIPVNISFGAACWLRCSQLEKEGKVPPSYHVTVAIYYFVVGVIVILLKGIVTERITAFMARRQGVEL